jgi:very-short-patch-repair endonuclease
MSLPEVLLWKELRKRPGGYKFRRQFPQADFSLDFACLEARICIEVDGEAHSRGENPQRDELRDQKVREAGFAVLRIGACEVLSNMEGVIAGIVARCDELGPLHRPSNGPPPRSGEDFR